MVRPKSRWSFFSFKEVLPVIMVLSMGIKGGIEEERGEYGGGGGDQLRKKTVWGDELAQHVKEFGENLTTRGPSPGPT